MVTWFDIIKTRMINPFVHLILEHGQIHLSHGGNCVVAWMGGLAIPLIILTLVIFIMRSLQLYRR